MAPLMCNDPRALGVADNLYEAWRFAQEVFGDQFQEKIKDPMALICGVQRRGEASGHLDAALLLCKSLKDSGRIEDFTGTITVLTAAAVELIFRGVEVKPNG